MADKPTTWEKGIARDTYPVFPGAEKTDIAIVGGGITGITAAYNLAKAGREVTLIEKDQIGDWATKRTTAFLTISQDTDTADLIKMLGEKDAKQYLESHAHAIDRIEKNAEAEEIECEFMRVSNYLYINQESDKKILEREQEALAALGIRAKLSQEPMEGFVNSGYLEYPNQGKFHPMKYLTGLAKAAKKNGAKIYERSEAQGIERVGDSYIITTPEGSLTANDVIIATNIPFNSPRRLYFHKALYSSYVYEAEITSGRIPEGIYEDFENPYHYFRVDKGKEKDRMIIGGADHRSDLDVDPKKHFTALEEYLGTIIPKSDYKIVRQWTGPIVEPIDGLAFIGPLPDDRIFYGTGYSGNGMTHGTLAAEIFSDLILGKSNSFAHLYDSARFPSLKGLWIKGLDYGEEFFGGAVYNQVRKGTS